MEHFIMKLNADVEHSLAQIENDETNLLLRAKAAVHLLQEALAELKDFVLKYDFKTTVDEIQFYKSTKPKLFSKLLYYRRLYDIEAHRPATGNREEQVAYLRKEFLKLNDWFNRNLDFCKYHRCSDTYLDEEYFLRYPKNILLSVDASYQDRDPRFSTVADLKMAKLLAYERLDNHLLDEYNRLRGGVAVPKEKMTWTLKKVFLIELCYLLYWAGAFNHGKATLKQIIAYFERIFNIDLGANPSASMGELKIKKQPFSFLNLLNKIQKKKEEE